MIEIRRAETDADLEAWIRVRREVLPNESAGTLTELRRREDPERLLLVAEAPSPSDSASMRSAGRSSR
jgi:hypothetical protein